MRSPQQGLRQSYGVAQFSVQILYNQMIRFKHPAGLDVLTGLFTGLYLAIANYHMIESPVTGSWNSVRKTVDDFKGKNVGPGSVFP